MLPDKTVPRLSIDPFSDRFLADPYAHHDLLRDAGPVFWLECHCIYGAARHAEVSAALKDWQNFCSGRGVGLDDFAVEEPWRPPSLLLETDPPVHDRTRGLRETECQVGPRPANVSHCITRYSSVTPFFQSNNS